MESLFASTRDAALASALAPTAEEGVAFLGNPAGLGELEAGEFSVDHRIWMADTGVTGILTAFPLSRELGGLGLSLHRTAYGLFEGRDATGAPAPDSSADRWSFAAAWGKGWGDGLCAGVALRASNQDLGGVAYGALLADAGLVARIDRDWKLGLSLVGLGLALDGGTPPTALRLGTSYGLDLSGDLRLLLAAAGTLEHGSIARAAVGGEALLQGKYALRFGYRAGLPDAHQGGLWGLTVGAGYAWKEFRLDYAFLPMGDLGYGHQVGLSYLFPQDAPEVFRPTATPTSTLTVPVSPAPVPTATVVVAPGPTPLPSPTISIMIEVEEEGISEETPTTVPGTIGK